MDLSTLILIIAILCLYFLPSLVAAGRKTLNHQMVLVINLFLGWTFIGWVVALAMAYSPHVREKKVKVIETDSDDNIYDLDTAGDRYAKLV